MNDGLSKSILVGTNLVSFLPGVSAENRADILDALLLAELIASERYNREKNWEQWMDAYRAVLVESGLTSRGSLSQRPVKVSNKQGFRREAAKLTQTITPAQLAVAARSALDEMFNSDHARVFFSSWFNFNSGRSDSLQIVPCERAASGEINLAVCGLQMVTRIKVKVPVIFIPNWPIAYEMTLTLKGGGFVYKSDVYARHRERVQKELLLRAAENISRIPI